MFYQTAGYQIPLEEEFPEWEWDGNIIIRCCKDGSVDFPQANREVYEKITKHGYLHALALYRKMKETEKWLRKIKGKGVDDESKYQ